MPGSNTRQGFSVFGKSAKGARSLGVLLLLGSSFAACTATIGEKADEQSGNENASGGATAAGPPTFAAVSALIETNCAMAGCHGETTPADPDAFASYLPEMLPGPNLHSTLTTYIAGHCGNAPVVAPNNSAGSAIMMLALGQCGEPDSPTLMPYLCTEAPCLPEVDLALLASWIDAGAPAE